MIYKILLIVFIKLSLSLSFSTKYKFFNVLKNKQFLKDTNVSNFSKYFINNELIFEEKNNVCEIYKKMLSELYEEYNTLNDTCCGEINETYDIENKETNMRNIKLRILNIEKEYLSYCVQG